MRAQRRLMLVSFSTMSWRAYVRHPWQSLLSIVGVSLGVAVVIAIAIASQSARLGFERAIDVVNGAASHQIIAGRGDLDETLYVELRRALPQLLAVPVVQGRVKLRLHGVSRGAAVTLLGIDPLSEGSMRRLASIANRGAGSLALLSIDNAVLISRTLAARLGLPGDLTGQPTFAVTGASRDHEVRVIGSIGVASDAEDAGLGSLIVADISSAQQILAKTGKLTRIDLRLEEVDADALTAWLPQGAQLVATQEQRTAQQQMTRAFETNLLALSLLALLVGGFLIYNAMTFSVVRRRHQFGVMRAIGMTRRNILAIVIGEAVVIGIVASVLGLLLGWILAHGLLALVVTTINDLYYRLEVTRVEVKPLTLVLAFALGLLVSALAALLPALEASRVTPRMAMSRMTLENRIAFNDRRVLLISLTLIIGGLALVSWRTTAALWPAFGGLFLVMLGAASAVPWLMRVLIPPLAAGLNLWAPIVGAHASRALLRARSRTAIAVAALAIAMAATLGVSLMISSFRTAVDDWLRSYLVADIYLARDADGALLSPKFRRELTRLDGARRVSFGRWTRIATGEEPVQLFALETNRAAFAAFQFIRGDSESIWPKFRSGAGIIISEPFANHRSLDVGDFLALPAATGNKQFEVVGVYRDYGSDRGIVTMDRHAYAREFADDTVTSAAVFMDDSVPLVDLMDTIRGLDAAPEDVRMRANRELRAASLTVFDRTFAVTGVIRTLAIIVAVIGIIVALMAIQYERANEFALLRALGMLPRDLWRLILTETGLMGVIAGIIALPVGIVTAWLLVAVINRRAFGWSMDFHLDVTALLACIGVSLLAALAAGLLPALHIIRTPPATALRYE